MKAIVKRLCPLFDQTMYVEWVLGALTAAECRALAAEKERAACR